MGKKRHSGNRRGRNPKVFEVPLWKCQEMWEEGRVQAVKCMPHDPDRVRVWVRDRTQSRLPVV